MLDNRIRVLQLGGSNASGGVEAFQINLLRAIDKKKYIFDFVVSSQNTKLIYENEIKSYGGKVFYIPNRSQGYLRRIWLLRHIIKEYNYSAIHMNMSTLSSDFFLRESLRSGIKILILHSHTTGNESKLWAKVHERIKNKYIDYDFIRLACSIKSGEWMHCSKTKNNNFLIIKNGFDINKYKFSDLYRKKIREEFSISSNDFVIGHIARFSHEKNHSFIIKMFEKLSRENSNAKLLLVGDGDLKHKIEDMVKKSKLGDKVIFTGIRNDVNEIFSAMDVFILPSIREGLPFTLLEAQANGVKSLVSDTISDEACLTNLVYKLPINDWDIENWVKYILNFRDCARTQDYSSKLYDAGFDIKLTAKIFEKIYTGQII